MEEIKQLLKEARADKYACYGEEWGRRAVWALNEWYFDRDRYDEEIFDLSSDTWDELVKNQLESRGWTGLLYFLGKLEPMDDWAQLDGYGNATRITGADLLGFLEDIEAGRE